MGIRSMFSGVSGLQSHSTWLDVIGNNISNTNTVAYKASRVHFADQISQTENPGAGPNAGANLGGVNPQQVGLGTRVASIQTLFQQGPTLNTGLSTDIAIVGEGFLVAKSGNSTLLTRAGNLDFDGAGNLVDQNGGLIQGWNARPVADQSRVFHSASVDPFLTNMAYELDNTNISQVTTINLKRDFVITPRATQVAVLSGNLDSFQQALNGSNLGAVGTGLLPFSNLPSPLDGARAAYVPSIPPGGQSIQQLQNFSIPAGVVSADPFTAPTITDPNIQVPTPLMMGGQILVQAQAITTNAWEVGIDPHHVSSSIVYDSLGNQRSLTIQWYQVNDLGPAGINTPPMSQALYAWYAFDTTGGAPVSNATLVGGTGIIEGDDGAGAGYDRGQAGDLYWGDFVWFNTDGSLASLGANRSNAGNAEAARPVVYLPPLQEQAAGGVGPSPVSPIPNIGAEITAVTLDFGTAGLLTEGRRDGLYSDAEGTYQFINGVNTYVPSHTAYVKEQDGYAAGQLLGVSFDKTGTLFGSFSNGQNIAMAQLLMAMPDNPEGLSKVGGNYYATSVNSGPLFMGTAGQLGIGYVQGNALEGSNVDLTIELSNMIIAQRGFEVNARVISVTNSTLETVTRLGQ